MNNPTEKSLEAELLPCPFCGGEARLSKTDIKPGYQTSCVSCKKCRAEIGRCDLDAATYWNTRKGEAARLKAMVDKPEAVSRLAIAICPWYGNVEADISPAFVWKELSEVKRDAYRRQAKAVLTELVKMVRE